jgi:hypothetical protein
MYVRVGPVGEEEHKEAEAEALLGKAELHA